jgi:hypothetical protein
MMLTDRPLIRASGVGKEQIIYRKTHIDSLRRHLYATGQYIYFLTHILYLVRGAILTAFTNVSVEPAHLFPIACEDAIAYRVFKSQIGSKGESEGKPVPSHFCSPAVWHSPWHPSYSLGFFASIVCASAKSMRNIVRCFIC